MKACRRAAQPRSILKLIVGRGLVLVGVGAVIGVFASFGAMRVDPIVVLRHQ